MSVVIEIKRYQKDYQEAVLNLILNIQQDEYGIAITKEDQPDLFKIEAFYQNGNGNFWVALHDGEVVGTISLVDIGNQQVALRKMFVKKTYRGKDYGTASHLLQTALEWARERNITGIYLGTVPEFLAAHRFYEKNGFEQIDRTELPENFPVVKVDKLFYQYTF
ncbi:GNAT family acetyltransferase [Lysinibacillus contaminans]|uniref:GNAT family acetyltransferase n=1 Tax=Lysinibacillus contaminans TaxID=1293441 RepID=A0ABR5K367_9BACI|nr:GNAT family N-acetyltransferase [Lysinibacillus contaminans]KOS68789.1 GNAT family acetyltransferase [Lysinibacillus contaminans]